MGSETRRRNKSTEDKSGGDGHANGHAGNSKKAEKVVHTSSGGLGLIPVVLISAILAGSGCYVIKKDSTAALSNLEQLTQSIKNENSAITLKLASMEKTVEGKDEIISKLQKSIVDAATKNKETNAKLDKLEKELVEAEAKAAERGEVSDKNGLEIERISNLITHTSELVAQNSASQLAEGDSIKTEIGNKVNEVVQNLNNFKQTVETDIQEITANSESSLLKLKSEIEANDGAEAIAKYETLVKEFIAGEQAINANTAGEISSLKELYAQLSEASTKLIDEVNESTSQIGDDIADLAAQVPGTAKMIQLTTQSQKAEDGLKRALEEINLQAKEVKEIKTSGQKELRTLNESVSSLRSDLTSSEKGSTENASSIENVKVLVNALSSDISAIKKRQAEMTKKLNQSK